MADVASLSIRADSTQVTQAKRALDSLAASGTKLTRVTESTQRDFVRMSGSAGSYAKSINVAEAATENFARTSQRAQSRAFRPMGGSLQQIGYQVGDFAVQVGAGQSALVAFSQQGSQLAGIFGPGGAVLGAVLAVGAALGGAFMRGAEDASGGAETLIEKVRELELAFEDLTGAQRAQLLLDFESEQRKREQRMATMREEIERLAEVQERYNQQLENTRSAESQIFTGGTAAVQRITQGDAESASREALALQARLDALEQEAQQAREGMEGLVFGFDGATDSADKMASKVDSMVEALGQQAAAIGETNRQTALRIARENEATEAQIAAINASYDALEADEQRLEFNKSMTQWADRRRQEIEREEVAQRRYIASLKDAIDPMQRFERESSKIWEAFNSGELGDIGRDQVDAYVKSIKPGAEAVEDEFSKSAERIGQSLQDNISSGNWQGIGLTIGGALAGGIGSSVANMFDSNILGSLAGGVAGGLVGLAISEAIDYLAVNDPTERRQSRQGTGTVLGSLDEKSSSIQDAVESIESTNDELVNINTGMLSALRGLQQGISGASSAAARGMPEFDPLSQMSRGEAAGRSFSTFGTPNFLDPVFEFMDDMMFGALSWVGDALGAKSKVVDEGIILLGGALTDAAGEAMNGSLVEAFNTVAKKKNFLDDYDNYEKTQALSQSVQNQFAAVFGGITDTILEGATALGMKPSEIQDELDNFVFETQKISLEGLSAEEQADEIEAVFSSIFDQAVTAVIPSIEQFQQAGEGLGETLARVATEVQLVEEAGAALGILITNTEALIEASTDLVGLSGGIEQFSNNLVGFEKNFISSEEQFRLTSRRLTDALDDLPLPETRDGFAQLVKLQDASTEAGRENIATLLGLQSAADAYYSELERQQEEALRSAQQATDEALGRLQDAVNERKDVARDIYQDEIADIQEAAELRREANKLAFDAAQEGLSRISEEVSGLTSAADSLRESYEPIQALRRSTALDRLSRALQSGDLTGVGEAAGIAANIGTSDFGTGLEFRRAQATTLSLLTQLEREGLTQQDAAEQAVTRLEEQTEAINSQTERQLAQAQEAYENEIARLDAIYQQQVDAVDAARGIETGVLAINSALRGIASALGAETSVPGFASGGMHSGGFRVVGEAGPELEFTGPSRVMSNSDSRKLLNFDELVNELRDMKTMMRQGQLAIAKNTGKTAKQLERWDVDGLPEERT